MPHPAPLRSGDPTRVGRYQLTGRLAGIPSDDPIFIGAGPDGTPVAITVLSGDWALDAAARDRFAAEAAVAKRVPPFCAARVLDAGLDGSRAYLVGEYVQGQSLLELVSADGVRRGQDLAAVAIGMATGLASVHQAGLVHGNFGPEFVIMAPGKPLRVVEFGITPPYGTATPAADMLAWAQTVVFAASGRPAATLDDLDILPDHLRGPVERCLDPEPADRPAARAVVQSLLGSQDLPAGVLAEGSRRAVRPASGRDDATGRPGIAGHPAASNGAAPPSGIDRPQASEATERSARRASSRRAGRATTDSAIRHPGRRRGRWLVSGAILGLIVVAAVLAHALLSAGSHPSSGRLSADTGVTSGSAVPSASPADTITPAAFNGTWSGVVTQPPTDTYNVKVTFAAGTTAGTISYVGSNFSCSGALTVSQATAGKLVVSQRITHGQSDCENGSATITVTGANKIWFSFHSDGPIASGTLARH
jgi:eukaryotic-like serine/threonine-protein kinase